MTPLDYLYLAVAVCTLLGFFVGIARWIGKIERNTEATERLTNSFDVFTDRIDVRLTDHEQRISRLEGRRHL